MTSKTCVECGRVIPMGKAARCAEHERVYQQGRQKRRAQYAAPAWVKLRDEVRKRGLCEDCGRRDIPLDVHHRFPVAKGFPMVCPPGDLLLLCHPCHMKRDHGEVREEAPSQLDHLYRPDVVAQMRADAAAAYEKAQQPPWGDRGPFVA